VVVMVRSSVPPPSRDGRAFVPATAAEQLTEAMRAAERTLELEVEVTRPELTTDQAEAGRPTHLLSTFTTYYTEGQVRNANIQRLADVVDDTQVLPGEQFSVNGISGERTCAKGYEPAGTIVRGELVDTCGGGVSQFGTTTFNAAFFSGMQLDQWQAHSFYISRYPMGREATLSFPELDVRFTNVSDAPVVVRASYTPTSVTVSLYGQPVATRVTATHGEPYDRREPTTETRTTSELPAGRTRTVQEEGSDGFTVEVVRRVRLIGGGTDERTITTTYRPQNGIRERGTG
jgi:vancomycin resistance protein YoaR